MLILDTIIDVRSETAQFPDSKNKAGYEHGYILGLLRARNLLLEEIENLTEGKNA